MVVDEMGTIWLSDPWLTAVFVAVAVGLMVWCHRWLETGTVPLVHRALRSQRANRLRVTRSRGLPQQATATRHIAPLLSFRPERTASARSRPLNKLPRSA